MTAPLITNHSSSRPTRVAISDRVLATIVKRGFTIVELLVVIGIISIIGAIGADIFLNVTRSYNKATVIAEIQQNGNIALSQITSEIRGARSLSPTSGVTSTLTIIGGDGKEVVFDHIAPTASTNGYVARNGIPITDNAYATGVNATFLSFTVIDSDPASVSIALTLNQPLGVPARIDFQAQTTLRTSVSLRDY